MSTDKDAHRAKNEKPLPELSPSHGSTQIIKPKNKSKSASFRLFPESKIIFEE